MRIVDIRLDELIRRTVPLGFAGENLRTRVRIDCSSLYAEYPAALPCLSVVSPAGEAYPAAVSRNGDAVNWDITASDLAAPGTGRIQLSFTVNQVIVKSCIGQTYTGQSLVPSGDIPPPLEDWLVRAEAALARIPENVPEIRLNTTEYWDSQPGYIPARGCLAVYTDISALKIGDGDAYLIDLPFIGGEADRDLIRRLEEHLADEAAHVSPADRAHWNNKLNCRISGTTLVLNRE